MKSNILPPPRSLPTFAISSLIQRTQKKLYHLTSVYSAKETDQLIFLSAKQGKDLTLELLATEYSNTLDEDISAFLWKCHSIPAFLSNVTLNLFNSKTYKL